MREGIKNVPHRAGCRLAGGGQMSESIFLAVFLTLAGGFQDAYSYNCRGRVFANAQTGNIVLLGQNLAEGNFPATLHYLMPLAAFLAGVYVTEAVREHCGRRERIHWRQIVLGLEIALLLAAGLLPRGLDMAANMMLSFACAMQVDSFRKFKGLPCATTMCIGNMRTAAELLYQYHIKRDRSLLHKCRYYCRMLLVFAAGAALGGVCSRELGTHAIWCAAALLAVGFVLMFFREEKCRDFQSNIHAD